MRNDLPPGDARSLWQSQTSEPPPFSVEDIRRKAHRFQRTIGWRNAREYIAVLAVVVGSGWLAWRAEAMVSRIGYGLLIAGALYVAHHLRTAGAARPLPPDAMATSCVRFHRQEIERQRDLLRSIWRWYLGPLLPGMLVLLTERAAEAVSKGPVQVLGVALSALICVATFAGIGWLNKAAARRLDAYIRALDRPTERGE